MLSIRNIVKTYKPKKGVPVKALDGVSLDFKETGLVFILGKSGSGKSTLLNAIGGLDKVDSGEFIIKGKSSKEFTPGDFDAYRNTFIGFIFQEYNILGEFTVGQNIALAMELQGKKATSEALNNILTEVDLNGYASRKPNELSGGQKQRVAIARALIKEPEIIMADEPTGALDSNTGKQVFDTLKKLSKTKLVIVVSHDREFAEYYGDRVIELADGKIISDISKYEAEPEVKSEGINIIDNSILQIKEGYTLTENDLIIINEYLKKQSCGTIISSDKRTNDNLKQIAMISEDGGKASFKDTSEEDTMTDPYDKSKTKFIKSRLPYKNALKIGASSLKVKPLRLFFTILLSFISFAMFGVIDTLGSYDKVTAATQSIIDDGNISVVNYISEQKLIYGGSGNEYFAETPAGDEIKAKLEQKVGINLYSVYGSSKYGANLQLPISQYPRYFYYSTSVAGIAEMNEIGLTQMNARLDLGRMPSALNEIAITKYQYEVFKYCGISTTTVSVDGDDLTYDDTETGIIGKLISMHIGSKNFELRIVGVIDTNLDNEKYESLKTSSEYNELKNEFDTEHACNLHSLLFIKEGAINTMFAGAEDEVSGSLEGGGLNYHVSSIKKLSQIDSKDIAWIDSNKSSLEAGEILANIDMIYEYITYFNVDIKNEKIYSATWDEKTNYYRLEDLDVNNIRGDVYYNIRPHAVKVYVKENGVPADYQGSVDNYVDDLQYYYIKDETIMNEIDAIVREYVTDVFIRSGAVPLEEVTKLSIYSQQFKQSEISIVGVEFSDDGNGRGQIVISEDDASSIIPKTWGLYSSFIGGMPKDFESVKKLVDISYNQIFEDNFLFSMNNSVTKKLQEINIMIEMFGQVFLYIGIVMAVFSAILLSNFIAVSIANKKREIGILRAVGAKSSDVFTIFFNESLIIAIINFALALAASIVAVFFMNRKFAELLGGITLLSFGIRQIALMLALSIGVALIASFLPVYSIAKKQPIDSIQGR